MASCLSLSFRTVPSARLPSSPLKNPSNAFPSFKISTSSSRNELFSGASVRPLKIFSRRPVVVIVAATKKPDSAEKRHRQSEKRRIYHKSHKSEMRTRMKKVLVALEKLRKSKTASREEVLPIEKLIAEAYSAIDKAIRVGAMHKNTGAHRKSRLARRKKAVEIFHGWYKPEVAA
ncbi:hypothetical protein SUGI_0105740 [Cryptomeria japonica]|uniref:small ribosomal subunit protein bS20c n=1 Tax=Cryptomeria japonica TaxID=3369 RepID=UPI002408A93A|nr:small ribosomal subunit protein bS20c [Cryptomeria japonica]GLJ09292.1 hypothetical protein SUGI_0105740 [Cryptomeria japonica]